MGSDPRWKRATMAWLVLGAVMVGGYLGTPNADPATAVGMAIAFTLGYAPIGVLLWVGRRAPTGPRRTQSRDGDAVSRVSRKS